MAPLTKLIIDKRSYIPIYIQLKNYLKEQITRKKLKPDKRIPSENELSSELGISRMTVRHAIKELEREGIVYTKKGEGTFVKKPSETQMLVKLDGFSTEMRKRGFRVHSKVLEAKKLNYKEEFESAYNGLQVEKGYPIICLKRLRFLENKPFAIESSFLHFQAGEDLLQMSYDSEFSMYRYLEENLRIKLVRAEHTIEPRLADATIAKHLKIKPNSPVLFIKGTTYSVNAVPVEYLEGIYRGDQYRLEVEIKK